MLQGIGGGLILAIVNFLMVFVVLGGLAGVLVGLKRLLALWETRQAPKAGPSEQTVESEQKPLDTPDDKHDQKLFAAITAALHEFTSLPEGRLRIETIEPLDSPPQALINQHLAVIAAGVHHYLEVPAGTFDITAVEPVRTGKVDPVFAAISAALHEYLATPAGAFRIVRIQPVGAVNTWKIAGRLEMMGFDTHRSRSSVSLDKKQK